MESIFGIIFFLLTLHNLFSTFVPCEARLEKSIVKRSEILKNKTILPISSSASLISITMNYLQLLGRIEKLEDKISGNSKSTDLANSGNRENEANFKDAIEDMKNSILELQKISNVENYKLIVSREVDVLRREIWRDFQGIKTQVGYLAKKNELLQKGQEKLTRVLKTSLEKNILPKISTTPPPIITTDIFAQNDLNSAIARASSGRFPKPSGLNLNASIIFQDDFSDGFKSWSNIHGYTKTFNWVNGSIRTISRGDYGIFSNFSHPISTVNQTLVIQYSVQYPEKIPTPFCTYTFVSLYGCGEDSPDLIRLYTFACPKNQFGIRLRNPSSGNLVFDSDFQDYLIEEAFKKFPRFYTLIVHPNDQLELLLNGKRIFEKSFLWPLPNQGFEKLCKIGIKFGQPVEGVSVQFDNFLVTTDINLALGSRNIFVQY